LSVETRPLRRDDVAWLADLHNAAFADYAVPAALDAGSLGSYVEETGVDPALSRVAFVDGRPASFCLGAVRGHRASIRGEGTDPMHRRSGLGALVLEETLDALRAAGATEVSLEVLDVNDAAIRLYKRYGFEQHRRLLGYSMHRPHRRGLRGRVFGHLEEVDTVHALARIREWGWREPPWQLELATLAHMPALELDPHTVMLGKRRGDRFWLYGLAVDPEHRRQGLAVRALSLLPTPYIGVPALVPEEWYEGRTLLRKLGAMTEQHWQWEMRRGL
jgi:[ribosomal protein S18]-alanine N-acetyltransferase